MKKYTAEQCHRMVFAILCGMASSANAGLTGVLDLSSRDVVGLGLGSGESNANFASPKTFNATTDLSLNDVAWSDGAFSGVVDISLVATASGGAGGDKIRRGGKGAFGINLNGNEGASGQAVIDPADGTMTLSNLQFSHVSGDSLDKITSITFAAVYIGNWASGETGTLNSTTAITTGDSGGDTTATGRNDLSALTDSVVIDSTSGGFSINGVDLHVSTVFDPGVPTAPTSFNARAGNKRNFLTWNANTQADFKEFKLMRATAMGGPYTTIFSGTKASYVDAGLTNSTTYYYVVTAVDTDDDESAPSTELSATPAANAEPPNFLFIIADDMDTYTVNAYRKSEPSETDAAGNPYSIDTPNIDQLAADGMLFHQARIMGADRPAVCTPSRACIMTGKNTWDTMSNSNYKKAASVAQSLPVIFNAGTRTGQTAMPYATYRTCKGKNSYLEVNEKFTVRNDVTKRGNTDGDGSEWHADWGIDYLEDWANNHQTNGKPFFIWLGFSHPHDERHARETPDLVGRYNCINTVNPSSVVLNSNGPPLPFNHLPINEADGIPANFPFHPFNNGHQDVRDEIGAEGMEMYRTEAVVRNEIGRNFACVDWIDQQIGRVLPRLEDPNGDGDTSDSVADNTYIVFTSDHGIAVGRHGLQGKQNLYEHTWRVPYIVKGPGIAAGSESDAMIYLHESFPTFCDLAGIDIPATIDSNDGQSFRAVLEGTAQTHHDVVYGLYAGGDTPGIRAVTDGRFKLMKYDVANNATQVVQLFDLEQNPFELLPEHGVPNLAMEPAYAQIRQRLEEKLMEKRIEFGDPYSYLGDRTLFRFENDLLDRLPFQHDGTGNNGASFSTSVPGSVEYVVGEMNTSSLDLEQDTQQYVEVASGTGLNFGNNPFTIEAWVKLENLPTSNDLVSAMPLVQKKRIGANDSDLDYLFLAAAGNYGDASTFNRMALHLGSATIISTLAIPDTNWHYISVSLDPNTGTVRFQLDDQTDTQATPAFGTANDGPLIIGAHHDSSGVLNSSFDGLIDELSITDGFLADAELQPLKEVTEEITAAKLEAPMLSAESIRLRFDSNSSFLYNVESSEDLTDTGWKLERSFLWNPANSITLDLERTSSPKKFFRVQTVPQSQN